MRIHRLSHRGADHGPFSRTARLEQLEDRSLLSISGVPQWSFQGPGPIVSSTPIGGTNYQIGACEAIAIDPNDSDHIYLASVNGGAWKTYNAGFSRLDGVDNDFDGAIDEEDEMPTWQPLMDRLPSLSIGSIAFDPLDPTGQTVYAGVGGNSSYWNTHGPFVGIYRTTDGGATWTILGGDEFEGMGIDFVIPTKQTGATGQTILAGTRFNGIWRSTNTGQTWARVTLPGVPANCEVSSLVADPANDLRFYAAVPGRGVFRTTDAGQNWQSVGTQPTGAAASSWILLSVHYSASGGTNALYASVINDKWQLSGLFRSTTTGNSWNATAGTVNLGCRSFHCAMTADPVDANIVYFAGVGDPYRINTTSGTWTALIGTNGANSNQTWSHADRRWLAVDEHGNLFETDDGGLYRMWNPAASSRRWESLHGNLGISEVFSVAYDWLNDVIIGGTQDNGGIEQISSNNPVFRDQTGGDGNTAAVDVAANQVVRYIASNNIRWYERRTLDPWNQLVGESVLMMANAATPDVRYSGLVDADQKRGGAVVYIPFEANPIASGRLLFADNGLYESFDYGDTVTNVRPAGMGGNIYCLEYGGTAGGVANPGVAYVGTLEFPTGLPSDPQLWIRTADGSAFSEVNYPGGIPRDIALDPTDWHIAYVLDRNGEIWRTSDAGATAGNWTELTESPAGDRWLPDVLKTIELIRVSGTPVLLAGGDGGVYRRINPQGGSNLQSWSEVGSNFPNVPVEDMVYDAHDDVVVAGTLGRGIWALTGAGVYLASPGVLLIEGDREFQPLEDFVRLSPDPDNPGLLNVYYGPSNSEPDYQTPFSSIESILVRTGDGNDWIHAEDLPAGLAISIEGGSGADFIHLSLDDAAQHQTAPSRPAVYGGSGADHVSVRPSSRVGVDTYGGDPSAPTTPADTLNVLTDGADYSILPGLVNVTGRQSVYYTGFESVIADGPVFPPDRFESNDTFATAFDLLGGSQVQQGLSIHQPYESDWFEWTASQSGTVYIQIRFNNAWGNLDLGLYNSSGGLIQFKSTDSDEEYVTAALTGGQTYYIYVGGLGDATNPDYLLKVNWPFGVASDAMEPNDSRTQARNVGTKDQTYDGLTIHRDPGSEFVSNEDWFAWKAGADGNLDVTCNFLHTLGDIELDVRDSGGAVLANSTSSDDNEQVSISVSAGQTYYIRVWGHNGAMNPDYELVIDGPDLYPDWLEWDRRDRSNDTMEGATDLIMGPIRFGGLSIHRAGDQDWFRWTASAAGTLNLEINFEHDLGDLDLAIRDTSGVVIASSTGSTDVEHIAWSVSEGQTYYFQVYAWSSATNWNYDFRVDWPHPIPSDSFEPNDTKAAAAGLPPGDQTVRDLTVHKTGEFSSSEDWYRFRADEDGTLNVDVLFTHALGDLDVELRSATDVVLDSSTFGWDNERVTTTVVAGQSYYIRVYGYTGATHPGYELVIDGPDIFPDAFEPNNIFANAFNLGMGDQTYENLTFHAANNDDWYRWKSPSDGLFEAQISFASSLGDLDLALYTIADGQEVFYTSSTSSANEEGVAKMVAAGEELAIRVYGYLGAVNRAYDLSINGPDIRPDLLEPNDGFDTATDLGDAAEVVYPDLTIHASENDDYMRWLAPMNGTLAVGISFDHDLGDLDLQLYDSQRQLVAQSLSTTDMEHLESKVTAGQYYYVRILGPRASVSPRYLIGPRFTVYDGNLQSDYGFQLQLTPDSSIPGDLNGDGMVGSADLDIVRGNWGSSVTPGDLPSGDPSGDGSVGSADLDIVRANWGATAAAATALGDHSPTEKGTNVSARVRPSGPGESRPALAIRARAEAAWAEAIAALARDRLQRIRTASRCQAVDLILSGLLE